MKSQLKYRYSVYVDITNENCVKNITDNQFNKIVLAISNLNGKSISSIKKYLKQGEYLVVDVDSKKAATTYVHSFRNICPKCSYEKRYAVTLGNYFVRLLSFEYDKKALTIICIKKHTGLDIIEAKHFVDNVPQIISFQSKAKRDLLVKDLKELGCEITY